MVRGAWVLLGSVVLGWGLVPAQGLAQDAAGTQEARQHFDAGTEAFEVGEYERAATEFRAAYDLTQHPDLLFNVYSALERAGRFAEAADALEGYLRDGDPDEERRTALQARLARLRARIAEARAEQAEAELRAAREATPAEVSTAPTESDPPPPPPSGVHPAGVGVLIGGGVLLATFAVFAGLAAAEDGSLSGSCSPVCTDDDVSTLATFSLVADISWISGAVVAATGLILLFVLPPEGGDATAAVAPWVTPDGAGAVAVGRF